MLYRVTYSILSRCCRHLHSNVLWPMPPQTHLSLLLLLSPRLWLSPLLLSHARIWSFSTIFLCIALIAQIVFSVRCSAENTWPTGTTLDVVTSPPNQKIEYKTATFSDFITVNEAVHFVVTLMETNLVSGWFWPSVVREQTDLGSVAAGGLSRRQLADGRFVSTASFSTTSGISFFTHAIS